MKDNELKTIETYIPLKYHIYFENDIEKIQFYMITIVIKHHIFC